MSLTTGILHNLYSHREYKGRRARVARRLRNINAGINDIRTNDVSEKWKRRDAMIDVLENMHAIPDVQGTLIFVMTESMCDTLERGERDDDIRNLGAETYIMLGNPLLARMYDA